MLQHRNQIRTILVLLIFTVLAMTVCSMTSFLYPLHDRVDQNVFFTIGREMLKGKVMYKDLAEQKGPYVYLFNAVCAAISAQSMIGIYFFQLISFFLFLCFCFGIARRFSGERTALLAACITGTAVVTANCFLRGDNVEELAFMLMAFSVWLNLRENVRPCWVMLGNGIAVGLIFWVKFNLLGFWLGWFLLYFGRLLRKKEWKIALSRFAVFLGGFFVTAIPPLVYGILTHSVSDCFSQYFYANIFLYSGDQTLWEKVQKIFEGIGRNAKKNPIYFTLIHAGLVSMIRRSALWKRELRNELLFCYLVLYAGCFFGGVWYDYYYLNAALYVLFGVIVCLDALAKRVRGGNPGHAVRFAQPLVYLCLAAVIVLGGNCRAYYRKPRSAYPQEQFAEIIREAGGETLLNFGFIDQGFYLASGITPSNKYFSKMNIGRDQLPEMYEDQWYQIEHQTMDFVVIRTKKTSRFIDYSKENPVIKYETPAVFDYYEIVAEAVSVGDNYRYALLKPIALSENQTVEQQ